MILGLGTDFWVCLCLGGWISRECAGRALPFSWLARLVCSLGMPAGVRGEDAGMSGVGR